MLCLALLSVASLARAQTTVPFDKKLDFGAEGLVFPPAVIINGHVPRTAQLLGDAYRAKEPLEWRRVQLVAELGQVALPAGAPFLVQAMSDPSPAVRAEAARSAGMIEKGPAETLLAALEKLLADPEAAVRREAVLSAATIARAQDQPTTAIDRGLADAQPPVIAAALQRAWTPAHAESIAKKLPSLPKSLHAEAAGALARMQATEHANAIVPLLAGDVPQRVAAVRACELKNAGTSAAVAKVLTDVSPTVRREAISALAKLDAAGVKPLAISILTDPDLTVREAAVRVLTPIPSAEAMSAIAAQLGEDYGPLHAAARAALIRHVDEPVKRATIALAAGMLKHADLRRREDASYVLGRLRSGEAFDDHVALLAWDISPSSKTDWPLVAQAAESLGLIGDARAAEGLMKLAKIPTDSFATLRPDIGRAMGDAMGSALAALGRIGHRPALAEAIRLMDPDLALVIPGPIRTGAAFAIGMLGDEGNVPGGVDFLGVYASSDETLQTKFEGLKALGNLRVAALADKLRTIGETDLTPQLRWTAHWSFQRAANTTVSFAPSTERREPSVSISDLP